MRWYRRLPRTVIMLGFVSLFTDLSSEMIYPLLPLFLTGVLGAGPAALGLIEGVAESTASILKLASGWLSDRVGKRKPLVTLGYGIASFARPLIGLATAWPAVLALRFLDRSGKGVRTSPRDALLADVTPDDLRGAAYGVHRAMDHAGAVLGPLVAVVLLRAAGLAMRQIFLLAAIPGVIVLAILILGVREPRRPQHESHAGIGALREAAGPLRPFLIALLVFTLGNSTDAFLLLRLSDAGIGTAAVAGLWAAHNVVRMASNWFGGRLSDVAGRRRMMLTGWTLYALVYATFALGHGRTLFVVTFLGYGLYFGLTEPVEKAWVADLAPTGSRGAAFGLYHLAIGLAALPASVLFGAAWKIWGAPVAFGAGAALAAIAALLLRGVPEPGAHRA
ncbi:MAG: MFS transporter [Acidobacteria bacterium]|nr:MFS transporter [Acidobacteriota bacterium]